MENERSPLTTKRNFILQQGLNEPSKDTCPAQYSAMMFQPRIVAIIVVLGVFFQSPAIFVILSAVLWWSALLPHWNPFDAIYNHTLGKREGAVPLARAPGPRRFAQGMAGTFSLVIGVLLLAQWRLAAYLVEFLFLLALSALVFGGFCVGSFIFHLIHRRSAFAKRTLPWSRDT